MVKHTDYCKEKTAQYGKDMAAFVAKYPNYCKRCGGEGVIHYPENQSPLGSGMVWMEDLTDACDCITEEGRCPLCATPFEEDDEDCEKCLHCEWHWELGLTAPYYECECWRVEIDNAEEVLATLSERDAEAFRCIFT